MTREERCKLAIERGYTYDPETGFIFNKKGGKLNLTRKDGYIKIGLGFNNKVYQLFGHHFAYYYIYNEIPDCIDHINRIRNDNRIENLRNVTAVQNKYNISNTKGFYFNKFFNKYQASIYVNNKNIYLGRFDTEAEAREAYLNAKAKYHII